jgi:hypothetical protein
MDREAADVAGDPRLVDVDKSGKLGAVAGRLSAAYRNADFPAAVHQADAPARGRKVHAGRESRDACAHDHGVVFQESAPSAVRSAGPTAEIGQNAAQTPQSRQESVMRPARSYITMAAAGQTAAQPAHQVHSFWFMTNKRIDPPYATDRALKNGFAAITKQATIK